MTPTAHRIATAFLKHAKDPALAALKDGSPDVLEALDRVSKGGETMGDFTVGKWEASIGPYRGYAARGLKGVWMQRITKKGSSENQPIDVVCFVTKGAYEEEDSTTYELRWLVRQRWAVDETVDIAKNPIRIPPKFLANVAREAEEAKQTFMAQNP